MILQQCEQSPNDLGGGKMQGKVKLEEMYGLMLAFFKHKATNQYINTDKQEITVILYSSFLFKFGLDDRYNFFKGGIFIDENHCVNNFFGEKISINSDESSIINNFKLVDKYCRLRLPDKFLEEYDKMEGNY